MPGGPRGALVDEVNGDSIWDQIPLPHGHGSVNFRFSMIPSSLKFQVSPAPSCAGPIRKGNFPSHRSLKRKRGVGEHPESSRLSCLAPWSTHFAAPQPLARASGFLNSRINGRPGGASSKSSFSLVAPPAVLAPFENETSGSCSGTGIPARDSLSVDPRARQSWPGRPCHSTGHSPQVSIPGTCNRMKFSGQSRPQLRWIIPGRNFGRG